MEVKENKYKEWKIYSPFGKEEVLLENIGKRIIDNNFKLIKILKDTKRNYVAIIEIEKIKYILKEFRSEVIIPQRHIQTIFKDGEALTTLKNGLEAIEEGIDELVKPLIALVKKNWMIEKSYLLMEYIEGSRIETKEDVDKIIKLIKKVHQLGRYHGDLNTSNFIKLNNEIKMIDTQIKKEKILFFKRAYDIFTLEEDILVSRYLFYDVKKEYGNIRKGLGYFIAKSIKNIKKLKIINIIKKQKKKLRNKGWKI